MNKYFKSTAIAVFLGTLTFVAGEISHAADEPPKLTLQNAAKLIANRVNEYADTREKNAILVASFTGPNTSGGRGIEDEIRKNLKDVHKMEVLTKESEVEEKEGWKLQGRLQIRKEKAQVVVKVSLVDHLGEDVGSFSEEFNSEETPGGKEIRQSQEAGELPADQKAALPIDGNDATLVAGGNTDTLKKVADAVQERTGVPAGEVLKPIDAQPKPAQAKIGDLPPGLGGIIDAQVRKDAFVKPDFIAENAVVRPVPGSLFGMAIWASLQKDSGFKPLPVSNRNGKPFVDLQKGAYYRVQIVNDGPQDLGVEVLIDGINSLRFADDVSMRDGKWVVEPSGIKKSPMLIPGWFKRVGPGGIDTFQVTDADGSVAVQLGEAHSTGMIQARFYTARPDTRPAPVIDSLLTGGESRSGGFTGKGPPADFNSSVKEYLFGAESLALITIRYDNPVDLPTPAAPK